VWWWYLGDLGGGRGKRVAAERGEEQGRGGRSRCARPARAQVGFEGVSTVRALLAHRGTVSARELKQAAAAEAWGCMPLTDFENCR
jgi:hypothetical protein